jgi:hypothetical protein
MVGETVMGSFTTPLSKRFTFSTSAACCFGGHVLVHDADSAFLRERDGEPCLGHRVHGGREHGDVQLDRAGEAGGEADFAGQDGRVGWNEENVVECECFLYDAHPQTLRRKTKLYRSSNPGQPNRPAAR